MLREERTNDLTVAVLSALESFQSDLWTAMPGIIESFDPAAMTCTVQVAIQVRLRNKDGSFDWITISTLQDCPVQFQGGGGCTLTFPLMQGDECLVVFASRCIDSWWQNGGVQIQSDMRMHDLSDGFVLPGVRSQPRKFTVNGSAAQLRSDDGEAYVEVNPTTHEIKALTSGNITVLADGNIDATAEGNITATAINITADAGGDLTATAVGNISIVAQGAVSVTSTSTVNITAPAVNLGATGQSLLGMIRDTFITFFNNHRHTSTTEGTPTSTPIVPMDDTHTTTTVKGA